MNHLPPIAVLGTGSIGQRHLKVLKDLGVPSIAVPVRPGRRPTLEAQGWETAGSLHEAARKGAQAVVVATDTARHVPDVQEALASGFSVLCEKPLAPDARSAFVLQEAVRATSLPVFTAYCMRFDVGLQALEARLPEVGPIHGVRVECRSYLPEWRPDRDYRQSYSASAEQGGVIRDLSHEIDYIRLLFGEPSGVHSMVAGGRLGIAAEEAIEAHWAIAGGAFVSMALDYLSRIPVRYVRAAGAEGEVSYDFLTRRLLFAHPGHPPEEEAISGDRGDMYQAQMAEFLNALERRESKRLATLEDGLAVLAMCDALRESARSGCEEEVMAWRE